MQFQMVHRFLGSVILAVTLLLSGCSSKQAAVNFKIHSEPEGAHIVYKEDNLKWIYLGITPLNAVESLSNDFFEGDHTLTLRAMRCGYNDQTKEWPKDGVEEEINTQGKIFWAPRLIKDIP